MTCHKLTDLTWALFIKVHNFLYGAFDYIMTFPEGYSENGKVF